METIVTEKLSKRYGSAFHLEPLSLCVQPGEILGVSGPKAAGKTTLLRLIWGFTRPDQGSVHVFGLRPHLEQLKVRIRAGYLSEDPRFHDLMTAPAYLKFIGNFYENWDHERVSELLEEFRIEMTTPLWEISDADRAKIALIAAIGHRPSLLILDEPIAVMHPLVRADSLRFVQKLSRKEKMTIVISSRLPEDLNQIADSILELDRGQIVEYSQAAHLLEKNNARGI
jgi:ABC-2 type transport system ATP-binding protein